MVDNPISENLQSDDLYDSPMRQQMDNVDDHNSQGEKRDDNNTDSLPASSVSIRTNY